MLVVEYCLEKIILLKRASYSYMIQIIACVLHFLVVERGPTLALGNSTRKLLLNQGYCFLLDTWEYEDDEKKFQASFLVLYNPFFEREPQDPSLHSTIMTRDMSQARPNHQITLHSFLH